MTLDDSLIGLGFTPSGRDISELHKEFVVGSGLSLPSDYLRFLTYEPPEHRLDYQFEVDGRAEEGFVDEILFSPSSGTHPSHLDVIVSPDIAPDSSFLQICTDGGGNYVCLRFRGGAVDVVDVDYSSGSVSRVSDSFMGFIAVLKIESEDE